MFQGSEISQPLSCICTQWRSRESTRKLIILSRLALTREPTMTIRLHYRAPDYRASFTLEMCNLKSISISTIYHLAYRE